MGILVNGKAIAEKIEANVRQRVLMLRKNGVIPRLAVILVGNDPRSEKYVHLKQERAKNLGIELDVHRESVSVDPETLTALIDTIQNDAENTGLIIQLPLPGHLDTTLVLNHIDPRIDVDCLSSHRDHHFIPPTPGAILSILEELEVNPKGKKVTIVGTGPVVGRPLAELLLQAGAEVTACNSRTTGIDEKCREADILIAAAGKPNLIKVDMVKPGAIVIDAGTSIEQGTTVGDVDYEKILPVASAVTPTPGGVGPITVARLLLNTVICAEKKEPLG